MNEELPDREQHEQLVLQAIIQLHDASFTSGDNPGMWEVMQLTGIEKADVNIAALALERDGFVTLTKTRGDDELKNWYIRELGSEARRRVRDGVALVASVLPLGTYIQDRVIEALRARANDGHLDYSKLLRLVEELNACHAQGLHYAAYMLTRAILDHVPPLFGYKSFTDVANQYTWSRTDKNYMRQLLAFRVQADDALHRQISPNPDFLTMDALTFGPGLNTLLFECARGSQSA